MSLTQIVFIRDSTCNKRIYLIPVYSLVEYPFRPKFLKKIFYKFLKENLNKIQKFIKYKLNLIK